MRTVLTIFALACVCALPMAWAQEPPPVAAEPSPAPVEEMAPPPPAADEPAPPPDGFEPPPADQAPEDLQPRGPYAWPQQAEPAPPEPTAEESLVDRAIAYYERLENAPPEVAAYLAERPALGVTIYVIHKLRQVLMFLFLFLIVGYGGRSLLRPLFGARPAPEEPRRYPAGDEPPRMEWRAAAADLIAWAAALTIACEAVGLSWVGNVLSALLGLVGMLINAVVWFAVVCAVMALIAWSFSAHGRRLVLSLVGYYYLNRGENRPPEGHLFTLEDGGQATIVRTDPLHSVMQPVGGGDTVLVPNADIMRQYYHWADPSRPSAGQSSDPA